MSPPNPAAKGPVVDPLHEEAAPPPPPAPTGTPVTAPTVTVTPESPPPQAVPPPATAAAAPTAPTPLPEAWRRLHLVLGGGYSPAGGISADAQPYHSAAPNYTGGALFIQPSVTVFDNRWIDFRLGANFGVHFRSVPRSAGSVDSSFNAYSFGLMPEFNVYFHEHFGLGLNLSIGYMGLGGSTTDVGAPFTAHLGMEDGNLYVGGQLYAHFYGGAFRAGVSLDAMPGGIGLDAGASNPQLLTSVGPLWTVFAGVDALQLIRNIQGHSARPGN